MDKMGFVSLSGDKKEITAKSCRLCKYYGALREMCIGKCLVTGSDTMQNDICGSFEFERDEKNGRSED